jgi:hypothetical protein
MVIFLYYDLKIVQISQDLPALNLRADNLDTFSTGLQQSKM